ncbi:hypothetical protein ABIA39_003986 [Nocardia sp. GAS34]|uniref:hypothetical protein n=1 Tax=unclassified Nocardia TaxID=2637762 RepID=UPI003D22FB92
MSAAGYGQGAWAGARAVADAVLYEGYLLYPYRASARKNQSRWQFGVLGPPGAEEAGLGEGSGLSAQFLVEAEPAATLTLAVRFLQLQRRTIIDPAGQAVTEMSVGGQSWLSWDEAIEQEIVLGPIAVCNNAFDLQVDGDREAEEIPASDPVGRIVRERRSLAGRLELTVDDVDGMRRCTVVARNTGPAAADRDDAIAHSFIGAHLIAEITDGAFVSLLDPAPAAAPAAAACVQHRCFPVLAGPVGSHALLLISPIILYDHPEVAEQSEIPLFDSTEIDEILTLRVMTLTDEEKRQARATDPRAAQIIDRCEAMTPEQMRQLHGVLRDPAAGGPRVLPSVPDGIDWWDPLADNAVAPDSDAVPIAGVLVHKDSRVRLHPARRADAHDLFYAGRTARVVTVHEDVDGEVHIGVVVEDDPAADLHEWYGRYLYFAPDEIEPLDTPHPQY